MVSSFYNDILQIVARFLQFVKKFIVIISVK